MHPFEKARIQNGGTAVVTGAGSGVGRASRCDLPAKAGTSPWSAGAVKPWRNDVARAAGRRPARSFPCDVSDPASVEAMGEAVLGPIRRGRRARELRPASTSRGAASRRCRSTTGTRSSATNLHGAYYCVRAFLPGMRARRTGTIININSDVGKVARDLAGAAYVSSKFGLSGLTQQINAEERGNGVRACSICPRDINTPLLDKRPQPPSAGCTSAHDPARRPCRVRLARRHAPVARDRRGDFAVEPVKKGKR